jgi:hypothetical protein
LHQLDGKKISKKYLIIVLMRGIAFVLFSTSRKMHVKIIGEEQIVDGFSIQSASVDL